MEVGAERVPATCPQGRATQAELGRPKYCVITSLNSEGAVGQTDTQRVLNFQVLSHAAVLVPPSGRDLAATSHSWNFRVSLHLEMVFWTDGASLGDLHKSLFLFFFFLFLLSLISFSRLLSFFHLLSFFFHITVLPVLPHTHLLVSKARHSVVGC